ANDGLRKRLLFDVTLAPFQPRPSRATLRRPILGFVLRQGNVPPRPGSVRSMTYDNPLDVNRGPLDLRQGDRHKSCLEFFPLDLPPAPAIRATGRPAAGLHPPPRPVWIGGPPVDHPPARPGKPTPPPLRPGRAARAAGRTLHSYTIGVLPILDRF